MPSRIQESLQGRLEQIDYEDLIKKHQWIVKEGMNCVISPDSDGLLCGLFMSHYLNWRIVGFYDGKVMLLRKGISCTNENSCFLDMEIFRANVKSIGHHMLLFNKNRVPSNWNNLDQCIQPNNMRDYDCAHNFRLKYPLATIHLLIGVLGMKLRLEVPESGICPLLFTDGTFNVLFKYPENVLNWLNYLKAEAEENPLRNIFENNKYSVFSLMVAMDGFFRKRDKISITNERGDRLRISKKDGTPFNIADDENGYYKLSEGAKERIVRFIKMLSDLTSWTFKEENWTWTKFKLCKFTKKDFGSQRLSLNGQHFEEFMNRNPLSWAITRRQNLEYTTEEPDKLA